MNWIIFVIIIASLVRKPDIRKETSKWRNLRKLKEYFIIALGLSLLFGTGWAVGLLASSELHDAVRYPAEWIFTLMTAFLGVYLFAMYILRSAEARKLWKTWLLCQYKKKGTFEITNTSKKPKLRIISPTVGSLKRTLQATLRRAHTDNSANISTQERNTASTSPTSYSYSTSAGEMAGRFDETILVLESTTASHSFPYLAEREIEVAHKVDEDRESINEANLKAVSSSPMPVNDQGVENDVIIETGFHENVSLSRFNAFSPTTDPSQSAAMERAAP